MATKSARTAKKAKKATTKEVFFDPSGRRWRWIKLCAVVFLGACVTFVGLSWGPLHQPPELHGHAPRPSVDVTGVGEQTPTIGSGPLDRLVMIRQQPGGAVAVDPLTGDTVAKLSAAELANASGSRYAILRYGYDYGVHRTIELTFDDGPNPIWTPQILDVLSKYKVPATFFVIGSQVVHFPQIVDREVREGHAIGNHTMTHPALNKSNIERELVTNDRIMSATAGVRTGLARLPYDGYGPSGGDSEPQMLLASERLGYQVSIEEFDTNDWQYGDPALRPHTPIPMPPTNTDNVTILMHDGGGNRAATVAYLERLIPWARAHGYTFHTLPQVSAQVRSITRQAAPTMPDREMLWIFQARWLLPNAVLRLLFWIAVGSVVLTGLVNIAIASGSAIRARHRHAGPAPEHGPAVTAVVAAFNEEAVIAKCLAAIRNSRYPELGEILVIDDGSTDSTADVVAELAKRDSRIRLIRQPNLGKARALNRAFSEASFPIVVTLDADTLLNPTTVDHLVRPFIEDTGERLGAVAGTVKVGNIGNAVTRWQALDYLIQVGIDRGAQHALRAIIVVPGACAAWRRDGVLAVGGYSVQTLAEDCDLALALQAAGYEVVQANRAECVTEAPRTFRDLARQRFRWTFGNAQSLWKHRSMMFNKRYGWLGFYSLPLAALALLMPIVFLPFVYAMLALTVAEQGPRVLLIYGALFLAVQLVWSLAAIILCRESMRHLLIVPIYRFIAEPLRAYVLGRSTLAVLRGSRSRWHKVARTGTVRVREAVHAEAPK